MINLNNCHKIGITSKTHGIKGNIIVRLQNLNSENILEMEWVFLIMDGLPVPFFVLDWIERSKDSIQVLLEDVNTIEEATKILGAEVFISKQQLNLRNTETQSFKSFIGFSVNDKEKGILGELAEVLEIQNNPVLSIKNQKKEILVPLQDEFVLSTDKENKIIHIQIPDCLIDL